LRIALQVFGVSSDLANSILMKSDLLMAFNTAELILSALRGIFH
jgi:hypothetical protein